MNKIQEIFDFDARIVKRRKKKEIIVTAIYGIITPSQWRYLYPWIRTLRKDKTPYSDQVPWFTLRAIDYLRLYLEKRHKIFEYGSGGSTLFYANHTGLVVSIEHDKEWYLKLKPRFERNNNITYLLRTPTKQNKSKNKHEYYRSYNYPDFSFEDYVSEINKFEDNYFDLVSIDGRARVACVREAYSKVRHNGLIVLDNSSRRDYFEAFLFLRRKGCLENNFYGLLGYETPLNQTTIWKVNKIDG